MFKKLSDNLNMLMAKARLNSNELAKLTGIPATTIKRIRTNEQSNPTVATLLPIAKHFSMTISELLDYEIVINSVKKKSTLVGCGLKIVPILSWHECTLLDTLDYSMIQKFIHTEMRLSDKSFALIVENKELDFFPEKSILIIEPKLNPEAGDYVVVTKANQGIASIKKYIVDTEQIYLKSLIQGLGVVPLVSEYRILGVIVQYKVELKK